MVMPSLFSHAASQHSRSRGVARAVHTSSPRRSRIARAASRRAREQEKRPRRRGPAPLLRSDDGATCAGAVSFGARVNDWQRVQPETGETLTLR